VRQTERDKQLAASLDDLFAALGTVADLSGDELPVAIGHRLASRLSLDDDARQSVKWAIAFLVELL
jgi:hypothetical protein